MNCQKVLRIFLPSFTILTLSLPVALLQAGPARADGPAPAEARNLTPAEKKMEEAERRLKVAQRDFEKSTSAVEEADGQLKEMTMRTDEISKQMAALHGKENAAEKAGLLEILTEENRKLEAVRGEARRARRNLETVTRLLRSAEKRYATTEKKYGGPQRALASPPAGEKVVAPNSADLSRPAGQVVTGASVTAPVAASASR